MTRTFSRTDATIAIAAALIAAAIGLFGLTAPAYADEVAADLDKAVAATVDTGDAGDAAQAESGESVDNAAIVDADEGAADDEATQGDATGAVGDDSDGAADAADNGVDVTTDSDATDEAGETDAANAAAAGADSTPANRTIEDGTYVIQSNLGSYVLDVANGSSSNGANIQLYQSNKTAAQQWVITLEDDGYYSIKNVGSGKYLDVNSGKAENGRNIWQYTGNASLAQRWLITVSGSSYAIVSAINQKYVIDVAAGEAKNGANVQLYKSNGTAAQLFWFASVGGVQAGEAVLEDGVYTINTAVASNRVVDISAASFSNSANAQIYKSNDTNAQRFYVTRGEDGFYTLQSISSGKVLDVASGSYLSGANVQQYESNDTLAQKWVIVENSDGTYTIVSALSGAVLDVSGGKSASGTNVGVYKSNGTSSQKWTFTPTTVIAAGDYIMYTMLAPTSKVVDVKSASTTAGTALQLYSANSTQAQKFRVSAVGDGTYTIMAIVSGLFLTSSDGALVQQEKDDAAAQLWIPVAAAGGIRFASAADSSKVITVAGGKTDSGTAVNVAKNTGKASLIRLVGTTLISDGYYVIKNASGLVLDVSAGSFLSGKNIQQYTANGSAAQVFYIKNTGSNYVTIQNSKSFKMFDVANAKTASGTNVQQYASNSTNAQKWLVDLDENGNFIFCSALDTSKVLNVASSSKEAGANVNIATKSSASGQKWRLESSASLSISGDRELDSIIASCWDRIGESGDKLKNAFNYVVNRYRYISGSKMPTGNWSVPFAKEMYKNGGGNCYRFASLFCWLAKSLGYDANVVSGYVMSSSGGQAPHGWVEIHRNGTTYVCDPDLQYESPSRNWYMNTYASAPTAYHFW